MNLTDHSPSSEGNPQELEHLYGKDSLKIDRRGARISVRIAGVQLLTDFSTKRIDEKPGVTHPCTPVFGNFGQEFELPQHGPARNAEWQVILHRPELKGGQTILYYDITGGTYPAGVGVTQIFELNDGEFTLRTIHSNKGKKAVPVNFGEHCYWSTNGAGWDNVTLNGQSIASHIANNGQVELKPNNEIIIPNHAVIHLEQKGLPYAVVWAMPHPDKTGFDTNYFCLEPVERPPEDFGKQATLLQPQKARRAELRISLIRNLQNK